VRALVTGAGGFVGRHLVRHLTASGDEVVELDPLDMVQTPPFAPHRWVNAGDEPFGFICTVERERDRPQPLDDAEWEALLANPLTAPFAH
jgi:nucleoside-diphosphate-sugar epimerase